MIWERRRAFAKIAFLDPLKEEAQRSNSYYCCYFLRYYGLDCWKPFYGLAELKKLFLRQFVSWQVVVLLLLLLFCFSSSLEHVLWPMQSHYFKCWKPQNYWFAKEGNFGIWIWMRKFHRILLLLPRLGAILALGAVVVFFGKLRKTRRSF